METQEQIQLRQDSVLDRELVQVKTLSLHQFWAKILRHKNTALATFALITLLGLIVILTTKPLYQARTSLLIAGKDVAAPNNNPGPLSNLFQPAPAREVDTQVEVLQSTNLLKKTAQSLDIDPKSVRVAIRQLGKTDLVELTATSNSREAAEKFAVALPRVYLQQMEHARMREVSTALGFAQKSLTEKTAQLERSEQALKNFKVQSGIVNLEAQRAEDITAASAAQATARQTTAEASSASASLASLRATRARLPSYISAPVTVTNPEVSLLQDRVATLREERSRLLFLYKPGSDEVRKVDVSIAALNRRLAVTPRTTTTVTRSPNPAVAELDTKIGDTWAQYRSARAMWSAATQSAARLQNSLNRYNRVEIKLAQLQRAVDQGRDSVGLLAKSVEELNLRKKAVEAADAPLEVVGTAERAEQIAPRFFRSLIVTLFLAAILACVAALIRDSLDPHVQSEDETGSLLGLPVLGRLPHSSRKISLTEGQSDSLSGDSYYQLWSNVQYALMKCVDRAIQVTSTVPGEGATMTAVNLAIETAMGNRRVILVDANLQNPQLDRIFRLPSRPGLIDVLSGRCALATALQDSDTPNVKILTAGTLDRHDSVLLSSPAMDELLLKLNSMADSVIIDSAPTSTVADAQMIASKVDAVLYVMQLGAVERSVAQRGIESLQNAGAQVLGVALNIAESSEDLTFANYIQKAGEVTRNYGDIAKAKLASGQHDTKPRARVDEEQGHDPFARQISGASQSRRAQTRSSLKSSSSALKKWALIAGAAVIVFFAYRALRPGNAGPASGMSGVSADVASRVTTMQVADMNGEVEQWVPSEGGNGSWQVLETGTEMGSTGSIRTGQNATLLLQLGQMGSLRMGADTQLKLRRLSSEKYSVQVTKGKIWALVKQVPTAAQLKVRTAAAVMTSESGLFSIASGQNGELTMISTVKGSIGVQRNGRTAIVPKGRALRINRSRALPAQTTGLQPAARNMWHQLHKNETWLRPGGELQLAADSSL